MNLQPRDREGRHGKTQVLPKPLGPARQGASSSPKLLSDMGQSPALLHKPVSGGFLSLATHSSQCLPTLSGKISMDG